MKLRFGVTWMLWMAVCAALSSCGSDSKGRGQRYEVASASALASAVMDGRTAVLRRGKAIAPRNAPQEVKLAIAAANRIAGKPYKWGGGHARLNDSGYDCSGAASYVLRNAGLLQGQMPSRGFLNYGRRGHGKWISVYARNGHVFMTIAGLRFDTQGQKRQDGPKWRSEPRSQQNHVVRHPPGL